MKRLIDVDRLIVQIMDLDLDHIQTEDCVELIQILEEQEIILELPD